MNATEPLADFWCLCILMSSYLRKAVLHTEKNVLTKPSMLLFLFFAFVFFFFLAEF